MLKSTLLILALGLVCSTAMAQRPAAGELPDGPGKDLVQANCTSCHRASTIMRAAGYDSPARWQEVIDSMIKLPDAQARSIAEYLTEHFPEKPERQPTLVSGNVEIDIKEWIVPTLGQRSRDPIEAPTAPFGGPVCGLVWWGT